MTGFSVLSRLDIGVTRLRGQLDVLTRQISDERKGPYLGDIAPEARRAVDLRGEIGRRGVYTVAIDQALGLTATTQNAMQTLYDVGQRAFVLSQTAGSLDPTTVAMVRSEAQALLVEAAQTLNSRYGDQYIFGGQDSHTPPLPDPDGILSSGMAQDIAVAVQALASGGAAATWAATGVAAASDAPGTTPFSAHLSDPSRGLSEPRRSIPAADGRLVEIGLLANRNAAATSQGNTTGSWSRDLLRGLAALAAVEPSQTVLAADFDALLVEVRGGLRAAIDGIAQEQGGLGVAEQRLERLRTDHATITTTLTRQLGDLENVDIAEAITRMQATRTQIEASYQAIALASQLTLARFL